MPQLFCFPPGMWTVLGPEEPGEAAGRSPLQEGCCELLAWPVRCPGMTPVQTPGSCAVTSPLSLSFPK